MMPDDQYKSFPEYRAIQDFYRDRTAKRSGVPLINHIDEGIRILQLIGASDDAVKGFCLHPIFQGDSELKVNFLMARDHHPYSVLLAMEYRNIANQYLRSRKPAPATMAEIAASPLLEVNQMQVADKIQNFKDFMQYHRDTHQHSDELHQYFKNWFDKLGIPEDVFHALEADSSILPEDMIATVQVNLNASFAPIQTSTSTATTGYMPKPAL